ncbi:MAG: 5'-deoxynucleotidase [Lachnospiraceae bacterium]|nr:5'-deoxynucleotidase [Lachnospiraceae bacterium]
MNNFFAYINRMKYISRWGLMQGTQTENDMEHTMQVVLLSHALSAIAKERLGLDPDLEKVVLIAAYHDVSEVITGDLATPVKYANPRIKEAFHDIEDVAVEKLLSMLPEDLKPGFEPYLRPDKDSREYRIVKAADKLSAYLKCVEELKFGNREFASAKESIGKQLEALSKELPELRIFMDEFAGSFELTLDELAE